MDAIYAQLDSNDVTIRQQAAKSLMNIKPLDEAERAAREKFVISCLGKPSEDYAMRVLATCGGNKSVKALEQIMDAPDAQRAVYAAWVLAQLPDKMVADIGLHRVAIFGMFSHQLYQQGAGIDFYIAPELGFHQTTERLNTDPKAYSAGEGPVRIPNDLLQPFTLNKAEQVYAVRCYQLAEVAGYMSGVVQQHVILIGPRRQTAMDGTYLPLLKEIAAHDSYIERLMVKGQAVAHFKYRQLAAKEIAAITKEKASYIGLRGETLDSGIPRPLQRPGSTPG